MSRYDWPRDTSLKERHDDPAGRIAFTRRRRMEFDPEGALLASRTDHLPADEAGSAPGPFAPVSGRQHLWHPLGPATLLGGQAEGTPRVSGRVNAISVHDGGMRAYAASANGGVWYTKDGGANWVSVAGLATTNTAGILRPAQRNACGAIFVDFGTAEGDDLVFLGTGEFTHPMRGQPPFSEGGIGILVGDKPTKSTAPDPWVREAPNLVNNGVYRIVREPGSSAVIAATRTGLFQRPASPGLNIDWDRPASVPFNSLDTDCTDLLWTPANGGRPARLWVWVKEGANSGLWVRDAGASDFLKVDVDSTSSFTYVPGRASLAASTPATQVWVLNDRGNGTDPALFRVTNPVSGSDRPKAHSVFGVPNILRDSGFYNIAIAIDPANPDRVALAGSYLGDPRNAADQLLVTTPDGAVRGYDASIVVADVAPDPARAGELVYGRPTPYTMIGIGVHPDVHGLAYSNGGASLWACCDGGIFRSDRPTKPAGFYARNNGLSISESNYIAHHPTCEGHLIAGLQDNGTVERLSNGVWNIQLLGDGGGVVIDASKPDRSLAQYVKGSWTRSTPGGAGPITRATGLVTDENKVAAFYSSAACIIHVRASPPAPNPGFSQTLIGTNRLWYSDDFGASWVTLPTGTDPLPTNNLDQDKFGQAITVCRWQSPDVAWVLGEGVLKRYARTPGSHNAGGPGTWTKPAEIIIKKNVKNKKDATSADGPIRDSPVWTDIAVNLDPPPGADQPPAQHGTKGAMYLGTVGKPDNPDVDTLWWFDGTSKWFKTGLRSDSSGVPAPVTAIVCDPAFPDEVYVGTTVGVWKGIRTQIGGADPVWTWHSRLNGLPEAAVEDLAIFSDGSLRLLRAAIAARGVWELRLDQADLIDKTYVRAHCDDLRYRTSAVDKQRDLVTNRSWHASPDVRPRLAPAPVTAPATLPWRRSTFVATSTARQQLRRFQAALRSSTGDPRIVANGIWDGYFSEVLRDHGAPTVPVPAAPPLPALNAVQINAAFWNSHMTAPHSIAEPWGAGLPSEADLYELTEKLDEGTADRASCNLRAQALKVDIVVHHRGPDTVDGANVRVTLLWWADPRSSHTAKWDDATTWFSNVPHDPGATWPPVPWTAAVNQVLNSADGKTNQAIGPGWHFALGNNTQSHRFTLAGQTLDSLRSGVATFDLNLSSRRANSLVILVAIIRAGTTPADDIALAPATLQELTLTRANVAVRSIHIT